MAKIAGRILESLTGSRTDDSVTAGKSTVDAPSRASDNEVLICTVAELRTVAASCLTQTKDKQK